MSAAVLTAPWSPTGGSRAAPTGSASATWHPRRWTGDRSPWWPTATGSWWTWPTTPSTCWSTRPSSTDDGRISSTPPRATRRACWPSSRDWSPAPSAAPSPRPNGDRRVHHDPVAVGHQGDRSPVHRLGCHVADAEPVGAAREPPVGDQGAVSTAADTLHGTRDGQHLAHAWTALRHFVAEHHHGVGSDRTGQDL